jgi:hypothetical protein
MHLSITLYEESSQYLEEEEEEFDIYRNFRIIAALLFLSTIRHESFSGIFSFVQLFLFQLMYICRENQTWLSVDREGK